jgi:coenzyme F420-reducing hydrogenase delta subunit
LEGDCHYLEGNFVAKRRVKYIQKVLDAIGIRSERIVMFNMSSAMGAQFAEATREMTERIRGLGPNPVQPVPSRAGLPASLKAEQPASNRNDQSG